VLVEKRNFAEFAGEFARDYFRKRHEAGLRVGQHGEVVFEGSHAVSSADPGAEDEGVASVEGDGWLDVDKSRRVRHVISGESPYLTRQLSVF
jgi:methionine synthase II (cobalamin-independent)